MSYNLLRDVFDEYNFHKMRSVLMIEQEKGKEPIRHVYCTSLEDFKDWFEKAGLFKNGPAEAEIYDSCVGIIKEKYKNEINKEGSYLVEYDLFEKFIRLFSQEIKIDEHVLRNNLANARLEKINILKSVNSSSSSSLSDSPDDELDQSILENNSIEHYFFDD